MTSLAIEVQQLHKHYLGFFGRRTFHALRGIDLNVPCGQVFGLLGPNGAGKTTLIKILLGIVRHTGGSASLLGLPAGSRDARKMIGYLPENMMFPRHHTALSAMRFYGRLGGVTEQVIRRKAPELLRMVGLDGWETNLVKQFSKGMRQRLCLAQALLHDPQLLIMDEPTDGLDPVGRAEMRQLIQGLKARGKTVFLNSHILQEVELVCDRVAILASGCVRGVGTMSELTESFCSTADARTLLQLVGTVRQIQTAIDLCGQRLSQVDCLWMPGDRCQLTASCREQSDLDFLIDRLRQQSVSISSLDRKQQSLEEIFLTAIRS